MSKRLRIGNESEGRQFRGEPRELARTECQGYGQQAIGLIGTGRPFAGGRDGSDVESTRRGNGVNGCRVEGTQDAKNMQSIESNHLDGVDRIATFVQIAEQNRAKLLWLAQRMTRDRSEAEDVVQEALLRAFKYLPRFRGDSQMCTWLGVIVKNTGREWLRERKGVICLSLEYGRDPDDDPMVREFPDPGKNPEQRCAEKELSDILLTEIECLNSACKGTMKMCVLEESSQIEAADTFGVSVALIKSRMFRGKRMLKRAVCRRIGAAEAITPSSALRCDVLNPPTQAQGVNKLVQA